MRLLRLFRKHGSAEHFLFASVYRYRGWTYRDRSCLPPLITNPENMEVTEAECLKALSVDSH